jgi:hypothetical protein
MAAIDITPDPEAAFADPETGQDFGWTTRQAAAAGIGAVLLSVGVPMTIDYLTDLHTKDMKLEQIQNPSAVNTCVTSAKWSGKLVLKQGAVVRTSNHILNPSYSNRLGVLTHRATYVWQFCGQQNEDGTWFGVDSTILNALTDVPTGVDRDGVVWIEGEDAKLIRLTSLATDS